MFTSKTHKYLLYLTLTIAFVLRFVNLGYSDFQGDEIKALFILEDGQSVSSFLLDQRKGPIQFLITGALKLIDTNYSNRFLIRLPFALAGFFAVFYLYKFLARQFNKEVALCASVFLATNGFFIAFSRIVQYQSIVILFMVLTLYYLNLANSDQKWVTKGIWLGLISWAISILAHYDGLLIFPFVFYQLFIWFRVNKLVHIKQFVSAGLVSAFLLFIFYIPFISNIAKSTQAYWEGRITGEVSAKLSSSRYLFSVYQPIYVIHAYTALFAIGCIAMLYQFAKTRDTRLLGLGLWLGVPLLFLEVYVYIPGTHIYTYLLPMMVIMAYGLSFISKNLQVLKFNKITHTLYKVGLAGLFIFISAQSYAVFIDNRQEYPWEEERWFIFTLPKPTPIYHLSMFGFPYYRFWDDIGGIVRSDFDVKAYSTNERASIARYHIPLPKDTSDAGYFVYVINPQTFTNEIIYEKAAYWRERYGPVIEFKRGDKVVVELLKMPPGELEDVKALGL